jgi:hypothetical protein
MGNQGIAPFFSPTRGRPLFSRTCQKFARKFGCFFYQIDACNSQFSFVIIIFLLSTLLGRCAVKKKGPISQESGATKEPGARQEKQKKIKKIKKNKNV